MINRQATLYIEAAIILACFVMVGAIISHKPVQTFAAMLQVVDRQ